MNTTNQSVIYMKDLDSRNCTYLGEHLIWSNTMNCKTFLHYVDQRKLIENQLFEYWIIVASIYIILMSLGFFMVEIGLVRKRNQMNIISKNFLSLFITALVFYLWGYSLSTKAEGGIIGGYVFNYIDTSPQEYLDWFYKFSVSGISASIVSGCLAERMHVSTYMMFTLVMSGAIYPIAASWCLGGGWLNEIGFIDAAGAGYIHMIGGVSGLVGTYILGPRFGVFNTRQ